MILNDHNFFESTIIINQIYKYININKAKDSAKFYSYILGFLEDEMIQDDILVPIVKLRHLLNYNKKFSSNINDSEIEPEDYIDFF